MDDFTFKLHSPITEEEWDILTDVDLDHSPQIEFHTKHGKTVTYAKVVLCRDCKFYQDNNDYDSPNYGECRWGHDETPNPDDFCSFGERIEE